MIDRWGVERAPGWLCKQAIAAVSAGDMTFADSMRLLFPGTAAETYNLDNSWAGYPNSEFDAIKPGTTVVNLKGER